MGTIKSSADIDEIFSNGAHFNSRQISMITYTGDISQRDPLGRVAFVAGKRLGNAVVRNRSKRVLRAVAREIGLPRPGHDVILIATKATRSAPHQDVVRAAVGLLGKAGL